MSRQAEVAEPEASAAPLPDDDLPEWLIDWIDGKPVPPVPESVEEIAQLMDPMGLDPEAAQFGAEEYDRLRRGVPVDEEPPPGFDEQSNAEVAEIADGMRLLLGEAEERIRSGRSTDDGGELLTLAGYIVRTRLTRESFGIPTSSLGYVPPVLRVGTRSREQRPKAQRRVRAGATRDGPKPRADDDPHDARRASRPAGARSLEVAARRRR